MTTTQLPGQLLATLAPEINYQKHKSAFDFRGFTSERLFHSTFAIPNRNRVF